jgi:hypothetical protein
MPDQKMDLFPNSWIGTSKFFGALEQIEVNRVNPLEKKKEGKVWVMKPVWTKVKGYG